MLKPRGSAVMRGALLVVLACMCARAEEDGGSSESPEPGMVIMLNYHKTGHELLPMLMHLLQQHHLAEEADDWDRDAFNWGHPRAKPYRLQGDAPNIKMICPTLSDFEDKGVEGLAGKKLPLLVSIENPILGCDDTAAQWGGEGLPRVAQFLRDPYATVISSFLYHSQSPTPEEWVHQLKPCFRAQGEGDEAWQQSQQASAALAAQLHIPQTAVQAAVSLHNQLFSQGDYYSALTGLSRHDAVRMEAARFFAFFPVDREHRCECGCGGGRGDMLRMAAGVNPLKKQFRTEVLLMGDWVGGNTTKVATITRLINLVCGTGTCSPDTVNEVAHAFVKSESRKMGETDDHVTHVVHGKEERAQLEVVLKADPVLGPLLDYTRCIITDGGIIGEQCCFGRPHGKC